MKSGSLSSFRSALSGTGADIGGEPELSPECEAAVDAVLEPVMRAAIAHDRDAVDATMVARLISSAIYPYANCVVVYPKDTPAGNCQGCGCPPSEFTEQGLTSFDGERPFCSRDCRETYWSDMSLCRDCGADRWKRETIYRGDGEPTTATRRVCGECGGAACR